MQRDSQAEGESGLSGFAVRVALAACILAGFTLALALLWWVADVLLLVFAGALLAVLLRGAGDLLAAYTPVSGRWSVLLVVVLLALMLGTGSWLSAARVIAQLDALAATLQTAATSLQDQLQSYQWGKWLVDEAGGIDWRSRRIDVLGKMTGVLSSVFGSAVDVVVVCFIGFYLAVQPEVYLKGAMRLIPCGGRQRLEEVLAEIGHTLRLWFLGTLLAMTVIGVLSGIGLWLLEVPLALALGILAGLLSFIPYLGAIVSAFPAMLVAMTSHGPEQALHVAALYLGIHFVEGYLVTPLVQQYAISLPPALLIVTQITLGIVFGGMGLLLAAPITAALFVVVKMLYVEDLLRDKA